MQIPRPDLSKVDDTVRTYIETLEAELSRLQEAARPISRSKPRPILEEDEPPLEAIEEKEPPTTIQVITFTRTGLAKRTPRHLYTRQRRGGMGIFDLDAPDDDPAHLLVIADESQNLILFTSLGRAFRLAVKSIPEAAVRARGESVVGRLGFSPDESVAAVLPDQAQGYVALLGQRGYVRWLRHHVFGEYMKPGAQMADPRLFGPLVGACWTEGNADLLVATRQGKAIRFSEKLVHPQGSPAIRLGEDDQAVAITGVDDDARVLLLTEDGRGAIRAMSGFSANKAPNAGGKALLNTNELVFAGRVESEADVFMLSGLSKIIRFRASDVPEKEGAVQGVYCMTLRGDEVVSAALSQSASNFTL